MIFPLPSVNPYIVKVAQRTTDKHKLCGTLELNNDYDT